VTEVAKLMFDAGSVVIVALISPLQAHRDAARKSFETGDFFEIFIDTPLNVAEARDPKGLYLRARSGLMKDFTGVDAVYEPPMHPDVRITTVDMTPIEAASRIVETLRHSLPTITAQK
jgi:adenylylsulfate kinase-like enzyme